MPTFLAAAGSANVKEELLNGYQAGDFAPFIAKVEALDTSRVRMDFTLMHAGMPLRYISPFYQSAGIVPK